MTEALRIDTGVPWLVDSAGRVRGYKNDEGVEYTLAGEPVLPGSTPAGLFAVVLVSQALLDAPTAEMLADATGIYALDEPPYTLYRTDGTSMVSVNTSSSPDGGTSF